MTLVLSGAAVLTTSDETLCVSILGPGDIYGEGALTGSDVATCGRWMTHGVVLELDAGDVLDALDSPELLLAMLAASVRRQALIAAEVGCVGRHVAAGRLARMMLKLHQASGESTIAITQLELSRLMGLQRTSVNAAVAALHALGAVKVIRGRFTICDPHALERAACCP